MAIDHTGFRGQLQFKFAIGWSNRFGRESLGCRLLDDFDYGGLGCFNAALVDFKQIRLHGKVVSRCPHRFRLNLQRDRGSDLELGGLGLDGYLFNNWFGLRFLYDKNWLGLRLM